MSRKLTDFSETKLEKFCSDSSFSLCIDVVDKQSIASQFPSTENHCGIYLLEFEDGMYYIGKSVDVVRRFREHQEKYRNISRERFRPAPEQNLDDSSSTDYS